MNNFLITALLIIPFAGFTQHTNNHAKNDKTIILTFDDASQSHYSFVAPLLKHYGFDATFYVCEIQPDFSDTTKYMNWRQIKDLSNMGFEIGNHTWHHLRVAGLTTDQLNTELSYIEHKCDSMHIPAMHSFCYPVYSTDSNAIPILKQHGYTTARTGGDRPYEIGKDDPMYIPSYTIVGNDSAYFYNAIKQTGKNKVVVFTIHGVPDKAHPWVSVPQEVFKKYMQYLSDHHYHVIAMKDLTNIQ